MFASHKSVAKLVLTQEDAVNAKDFGKFLPQISAVDDEDKLELCSYK